MTTDPTWGANLDEALGRHPMPAPVRSSRREKWVRWIGAIDKEAVDPNDVEMLQDLVVAAVNEAARKVDEEMQGQLGAMTGGMKIPGLF